jgi:hypothetical protein
VPRFFSGLVGHCPPLAFPLGSLVHQSTVSKIFAKNPKKTPAPQDKGHLENAPLVAR